VTVSTAVVRDIPAEIAIDGEGRAVVIRVEDTGAGIAPQQLERIFEPFTQADSRYTREKTGAGLGLSISRRLARLMGGDVTVESTVGVGSVFTLWLPEAAAAASRRATTPSVDGDATSRIWERTAAVGESSSRQGLAAASSILIAGVGDIVRRWSERLRSDVLARRAGQLDDIELEDHAATFLTDVGLAMRTISIAGSDGADVMRDGNEILRVIAERHGAQRHRLGWTEEEIDAEFTALREEAQGLLERELARHGETIDRAAAEVRELLMQFLEQAARVSRRAYRVAAAAAQR
jgi:hypothetical protein